MLTSPALTRRSFLGGFCACCALTVLPSCVATSSKGDGGAMSAADEVRLGTEAWSQVKQKSTPSGNAQLRQITGNVISRIINAAGPDAAGLPWEYDVFETAEPNAFALPGGKVGVNTGIFAVAKNEHQLATVLGHEIRHVTGHHGAQRYQQQALTNVGLQLASAALGSADPQNAKLLMSILGAGAEVGVILPFSREQETEADLIGLEYMHAAGFDPRESIPFWQNMMQAGAGRGPSFLSSHPAGQERIANLQGKIQEMAARKGA